MKSILISVSFLICFLFTTLANAGVLNYKTYAITTYAPSLEFPFYDNVAGYNTDGSNSSPNGLGSVLSTGTISSPSGYYWGSGQVLDSGRSDSVAVEITGYITWPGTTGQQTTVYFGVAADDGVFMNIDGTNVIQDWQQQGTATWNATGSLTKTAGQQYEFTVWMYEWGGGAALDINYCMTNSYSTSCQTDLPTSWFSTTQVTPTSGITNAQTTSFNNARNKAVNGNQIYITQTGNSNTLNILQDGDDNLIIGTDLTSSAVITGDNNALDLDQIGNDNVLGLDIIGSSNNVAVTQNEDQRAILDITGSSNNVDLDQSAINYVGEHYMEVIIAGNSNNVDIDQTETGNKKAFIDIDGSNNLALNQKGTGNHYAEITLTDSHNVDVTQDGSGDHNATINLSGNTSSVTLTQDSSTSQNYYLYQNCTQASCSATVTQN
jgi:hypothetical protein